MNTLKYTVKTSVGYVGYVESPYACDLIDNQKHTVNVFDCDGTTFKFDDFIVEIFEVSPV